MIKPKLTAYLEGLGFIPLDSADYIAAKGRANSHFEQCESCDGETVCPAGNTLIDELKAAMMARIRQSRQ